MPARYRRLFRELQQANTFQEVVEGCARLAIEIERHLPEWCEPLKLRPNIDIHWHLHYANQDEFYRSLPYEEDKGRGYRAKKWYRTTVFHR